MAGHPTHMRTAPVLAVPGTAAERTPASRAAVGTPPFAQVYEEHFDFVWRSARRLGVPEANLDDVVQDVFVTVYRRVNDFEGRSTLRTWIFGVLRRVVGDFRRTQRRKPTEALSSEPPTAAEDGPMEQAAQAEAARFLHRVLESLDDERREVFVLAELEQMSAPEIASALEVNLNTVYSRLRSARKAVDEAVTRLRSGDGWRYRCPS